MSNSPISSSRIDSKDESWLLLLSDPSAEKAKMRSKLVFFSCCTLMTMIPAIAALVLYPLGQVFAALISLTLARGLAGGFCLYVNRMLRPTHHIATAIERFRRGRFRRALPGKGSGTARTARRTRQSLPLPNSGRAQRTHARGSPHRYNRPQPPRGPALLCRGFRAALRQ